MSESKKADREPSPEEKALFLAEARKADAEARAADAVVLKQKAEAEKIGHEAEGARLNSLNIKLQYDENKRMTDNLLAGDTYNHLYRFNTEVSDVTVIVCMASLSRWSRQNPQCDMEIVFNSPGGSITEGFALYDYILSLRKLGHKITTRTIGMAASMAGILLQSGDVRAMGKESWLLIHEAAFMTAGKVGEVKDTAEWIDKMCEHVVDIFATRASAATGKDKKGCAAFVRKNWNRKDWWISAEEALKYGYIDRVD
jgi:ATP-dependent Clp endopeptidase proteolytic subunit ClpP